MTKKICKNCFYFYTGGKVEGDLGIIYQKGWGCCNIPSLIRDASIGGTTKKENDTCEDHSNGITEGELGGLNNRFIAADGIIPCPNCGSLEPYYLGDMSKQCSKCNHVWEFYPKKEKKN